MRVAGRSPTSQSHQAGMSSLWHDADYIPDKRIDTPTVEKGLEGESLPSERHQLKEADDPFAKQDKAYALAAQQMERGIRGLEFLNGKRATPQAAQMDEVTKTHVQLNDAADPFAATKRIHLDQRTTLQNRIDNESAPAVSQPKSSAEPAYGSVAARMDNMAKMIEALAGGMVTAAATAAIDPTGGVLQNQAVAVMKVGATANLAVGQANRMDQTAKAERKSAAQRSAKKSASDLEQAQARSPDLSDAARAIRDGNFQPDFESNEPTMSRTQQVLADLLKDD